MDTEDLAVNDSGEGEVVEDLCAVPPHLHKFNLINQDKILGF